MTTCKHCSFLFFSMLPYICTLFSHKVVSSKYKGILTSKIISYLFYLWFFSSCFWGFCLQKTKRDKYSQKQSMCYAHFSIFFIFAFHFHLGKDKQSKKAKNRKSENAMCRIRNVELCVAWSTHRTVNTVSIRLSKTFFYYSK